MIKKRNKLLDIVWLFIVAFVILWFAVLLLIKFYAPPPRLALPALTGSPQAVALVTDNWHKVLNLCPGLSKYQSALTFVNLSEYLDQDWIDEEDRGVDVNFKVSDDPDLTPSDYMVDKHACQYFISRDGTELTIAKRECASLCVDDRLEHSGPISGDL